MTKILLIEDNEMNRDMLARRLKRRGYDVIVAVDGQAGIDMAHSESPDLILMDLSLPVIDGWTADQRYDLSAWPAPPVVSRNGTTVRLRCGLSIVEIKGVPEGTDITPQIT